VTMPRLSDSMEEGTVLKWLKSVGDEVSRGEPLVEIETDKANMTYEADTDGVLVELVANEGDTVALGEPIARIGDASEVSEGGADAGGGAAEQPEAEEQPEGEERPEGEAGAEQTEERRPATATEAPSGPAAGGDGAGNGRIKASPVARRMARDLGVELARLEGSGPGGRIVKADVEAAAKDGGAQAEVETEVQEPAREQQRAPAAAPSGDGGGPKGQPDIQELTRLQQTVSRRMAESKATAPDFALSLEVDMTLAVELRGRLKEIADPVPSFNDMIVKAAATALTEFPRVNGAYKDGKWELYQRVNVGVAVAAQDTLIVPTIFDADTKSLGQIVKDARGLIEKVRDNKITPPELSGGTFTVSNLGMYGIERFTAIINPPQACILAVGALAKKPAVDPDSGKVVARDLMNLTLICDHRILYGADGAQYLARVKQLLEQPLALAL
jgi:pyruvate dehydrogenase E2 component (dihydrolipoamide acetyltransferase)